MRQSPSREMFMQDVDVLAPQLLGMPLLSTIDDAVELRITEVEAYSGMGLDEASHAHRGRTPRNALMFGVPAHLYVYRSYGLHWCCNVVCGPEGHASAVLLRAGAVETGLELARSRRPKAKRDDDLARGPGNLCAALGITSAQHGIDLLDRRSPIRLLNSQAATPVVRNGPRIGITREVERPWRWWIADERSVSSPRG